MDAPHAHRLRLGRISIPRSCYLITTVTAKRRPLFWDLWLGRIVVESLRDIEDRGLAKTWAFVVMPDHLHWLLKLGEDPSLSDVVRSMKGFTGNRINRRLGRRGQVWQRGFYDHRVRGWETLEGSIQYVLLNPIEAGLSRREGEWPLWDVRLSDWWDQW